MRKSVSATGRVNSTCSIRYQPKADRPLDDTEDLRNYSRPPMISEFSYHLLVVNPDLIGVKLFTVERLEDIVIKVAWKNAPDADPHIVIDATAAPEDKVLKIDWREKEPVLSSRTAALSEQAVQHVAHPINDTSAIVSEEITLSEFETAAIYSHESTELSRTNCSGRIMREDEWMRLKDSAAILKLGIKNRTTKAIDVGIGRFRFHWDEDGMTYKISSSKMRR